jgi:uncharacterized protein (DUF952 family)
MIYHITTKSAWEEAQAKGEYLPAGFAQDGFIHCSDHFQIEGTANRFYRDFQELIVLEIDPDKLSAPLIFENLEGGVMPFPHLYGPLPVDAVLGTFEFDRAENGDLKLPVEQAHPEPELFSELPFGEKGKVYRSPTPGSYMFDPDDRVFDLYLQNQISTVVVLNEESEHSRYTGGNLLERYRAAGIKVIFDPVPDFQAPPLNYWNDTLNESIRRIKKGENIAVHCHAGIGRTGIFAALLAHELLGTDADASIAWVREYIPWAIDTENQKRFVRQQIESQG